MQVIPPPIATPVTSADDRDEDRGRSGSRATGRPDGPRPRLVFDDPSRTITLDGLADDDPLSPEGYQFLKAIGTGNRCGTMVPGRDITGPGLAGKKLRRVVDKLPARWKKLVTSQRGSGGGYCLTLPPRSCP